MAQASPTTTTFLLDVVHVRLRRASVCHLASTCHARARARSRASLDTRPSAVGEDVLWRGEGWGAVHGGRGQGGVLGNVARSCVRRCVVAPSARRDAEKGYRARGLAGTREGKKENRHPLV